MFQLLYIAIDMAGGKYNLCGISHYQFEELKNFRDQKVIRNILLIYSMALSNQSQCPLIVIGIHSYFLSH